MEQIYHVRKVAKSQTPIQQMIVSSKWKNWMCSNEKEDVECEFFEQSILEIINFHCEDNRTNLQSHEVC